MNLLFKQMRRQWRPNLWLVLELVIISVVTWFITDLLRQAYAPLAEPTGYDISHVYSLKYGRGGQAAPGEEEMTKGEEMREIVSRLRRYPGVEAVGISLGGIEPYNGSMSSGGMVDLDGDSLYYGSYDYAKGHDLYIRWGNANPDFLKVFRITGARGETPEELAALLGGGPDRMLLSSNFVNTVDSGHPVPDPYTLRGHRFGYMASGCELAGIINQPRRNDTQSGERTCVGIRILDENNDKHIGSYADLAIRVRPEADKDFAETMRSQFKKQFRVGKTYLKDIVPFSRLQSDNNRQVSGYIFRMGSMVLFLLANVFLGLLGTFWYRTRTRVSEIALRKTLGATNSSVFRTLMAEGFTLLGIAVVIAAIIVGVLVKLEIANMQFYGYETLDTHAVVVNAVASLLMLAAVIAIGIWIPARSAMKVDPAISLRSE